MMIPPNEEREVFEIRAALYALGALSQHEARAFEASLLDASAEAAADVRAFEAVVTQLALAAPEAEPSAEVRTRLLARIAAEPPRAQSKPPRTTLPEQATKLECKPTPAVDIRFSEIEWKPMAEGIFCKSLYVDRERNIVTLLLKMLPGARVPKHKHLGAEQCFVIEGDFRVGGQVYGPGDFQCAPEGSIHESIYTETGALVLIISPPEYQVICE